jgi:hypothetical protein
VELEDVLQGVMWWWAFQKNHTHKAKHFVFKMFMSSFFSHDTQHLSNAHPSISWKKKWQFFHHVKPSKHALPNSSSSLTPPCKAFVLVQPNHSTFILHKTWVSHCYYLLMMMK